MKKVRVAVIGGAGLDDDLIEGVKTRLGTRYGPSPTITIGKLSGKDIVFLPRHGEGNVLPPHKINSPANILALHSLGVERIIATNVVGSLNPEYKAGDIVIPKDFIDFTKSKQSTFYDDPPVTHIDVSELYCPELREIIFKAAKKRAENVWTDSVYVCTEGPRYESPAEIRMFRTLGCDIIGMTGIPEAILAHELEICYATVCLVSNMATGLQKKVSAEEVVEKSKTHKDAVKGILKETIMNIPNKRSCYCSNALEGARV
ncbi:MAG: S-methyl-5'-thioinosine phosphorylase [Candidatus Bathyarchaeota archaeon]